MADSANDHPLVSIGLPVFNEEEHLRGALDSLLGQDYGNLEVVICDNASTDRTPAICAEYAARDPRVRYHRNETNIGGIDNFNRVFELARGEFFMWASGHDVRHPSQVSRCVEVLLTDPEIALCYTQVIWVDQQGRELERVHEYVDTRGLKEKLARLNVVLWGLNGGFAVYGVFRSAALAATSVYTRVVSPDISLLIELSLVGKFAYLSDPPLRLRRARDFGDWEVYVAKHFAGEVHGRSARRLYWRMLRQLCARVARHQRTLPGKALAVAYTGVGVLAGYRWMLAGLSSLKGKAPTATPAAEDAEARR